MAKNKFFTLVWRFNALVIAFAGTLIIVVLMYFAYQMFGDEPLINPITNLDDNNKVQSSWDFGVMESVKGTTIVIMPLYLNQGPPLGKYSSKKHSNSLYNLLFLDTKTNKNSWLLPTNEQLILSYDKLSRDSNIDESVQAILYKIVKKDSNDDGYLTGADKITIALSGPEGKNYQEVISAVNYVLGYKLIADKDIFLAYESTNKDSSTTQIAKISLEDFKVTHNAELPKPQTNPK